MGHEKQSIIDGLQLIMNLSGYIMVRLKHGLIMMCVSRTLMSKKHTEGRALAYLKYLTHREIFQFTTVVETSEFDVNLPKMQCFYNNKTL